MDTTTTTATATTTTTTTTTATKEIFSVINKFTENPCVQNISHNKNAISNNLAE